MSNKEAKKVKEAVALKYTPGEDSAPKIVAVGKGESAEKILTTAKENDVPVYEDKTLASALSKMDVGDKIPPELYEVIAEVLVFVSNLDRSFGEKYGSKKKK